MSTVPLSLAEFTMIVSETKTSLLFARAIASSMLLAYWSSSLPSKEMGVFDDEENIHPEDYEELTKPTTIAVDSFVNGDLEWTKKPSESDS